MNKRIVTESTFLILEDIAADLEAASQTLASASAVYRGCQPSGVLPHNWEEMVDAINEALGAAQAALVQAVDKVEVER